VRDPATGLSRRL